MLHLYQLNECFALSQNNKGFNLTNERNIEPIGCGAG
eukprot:COSAG02_NODE_48384_length_334_cov_0.663830_2_plen_36_part_01